MSEFSAHLGMEHTHRVARGIIRTEAVGTDQFSQMIRLVRGRAFHTPHFRQTDAIASLCQLPRRFRSGEPAANNMHIMGHFIPI